MEYCLSKKPFAIRLNPMPMIPSVTNLLLDYVFIKIFGWGMMGAAWATTLSYGFCASYIVYFFFSKHTSLHPKLKHFSLKFSLVKEITSLGSVTLTRQAMVSITVLLVNNISITNKK